MQMNSKMMSKKVQLFISGRLLDLNCFQTIIYTAFQDVLALLHTKITIASSRGIRYIQIFRENVSMCSLFTQSSAIVFFKKFLFNTHLLSFHLYISPLTANSLTRNHFFSDINEDTDVSQKESSCNSGYLVVGETKKCI